LRILVSAGGVGGQDLGVEFRGWGLGFRGSKVQRFKGSKVQGFKGSRVQGFKGSKVQGFKSSKVQRFKGSKVQRFKGLNCLKCLKELNWFFG
jgi:hypothetical protein